MSEAHLCLWKIPVCNCHAHGIRLSEIFWGLMLLGFLLNPYYIEIYI